MRKKATVSIYLRNCNIVPSSFYRITQYAVRLDVYTRIRNALPDLLYKYYQKYADSNSKSSLILLLLSGIMYIVMVFRIIFFLSIDIISSPDYLVVSKCFCPRYTPFILGLFIDCVTNKTDFIWDFDDDIFTSGEISIRQSKILKKNSRKIIVSTEYLKSLIELTYQDKVVVLPTTDGNLNDFTQMELEEKRRETFCKKTKIVWVATASNIPHLLPVMKALDDAAKALQVNFGKELELLCVCNKPVKYETKNLKLINFEWSRDLAKEQIYNAHIGIMPLNNTKYALGKGGFKLVQYMSACLPVIGSNVGYNSIVIKSNSGYLLDDEFDKSSWIDCIIELSASYDVWLKYSRESFLNWMEYFSFEKNLRTWQNLLTVNSAGET